MLKTPLATRSFMVTISPIRASTSRMRVTSVFKKAKREKTETQSELDL
jgi:hypothetical protein